MTPASLIHANPICPTCRSRMAFHKAIPRVGSAPELRVYKCEECGVRKTEIKQAGEVSIPQPKTNLYLVGPASSLLH
jgi:C4-type Zn-finger protein